MTTRAAVGVGPLVKEWRGRRARSQLDLAHDVGVSPKHLSFVETGRSKPSPELVLALAHHLEVPLREQNALLLAAGFAPRYHEIPLDDPTMGRIRASLQRLLDAHEPYPGVVLDRHWNVVLANTAAGALTAVLPLALSSPALNIFRASLHPDGLAAHTRNFDEWATYLALREWVGIGRGVDGLRIPEMGQGPVQSGVVLRLQIERVPVIVDATRVAACLVGLGPGVRVLGVDDWLGRPIVVHVETCGPRPACPGDCWSEPLSKDRLEVELVDLPAFGRPVRLVWRKRRWVCVNPGCLMMTWTEQAPQIAPARTSMTTRAGRWATMQVGRFARPVSDLVVELGCSWHTINRAVIGYGQALLAADTARIRAVTALGLDETLFVRRGRFRRREWSTSVVDVGLGQLLDMVPGRTAAAACKWLDQQPKAWRNQIRWATLDLSGPYRLAFTTMLPDAIQVADPFHVVKVATQALDEVRRRVQQETTGHRGRAGDPLYRIRRPLTMASERLGDQALTRLRRHLAAGDPRGEVRNAWHAREVVRSIYTTSHPDPTGFVTELAADLQHDSCPPEINRLGRTLHRWRTQIAAWHHSHVSNGPTEAINGLIKRVKRAAFGMSVFEHYRIRALLYAGKPNWALLANITPH